MEFLFLLKVGVNLIFYSVNQKGKITGDNWNL
jgi:hypothetical protein